MTNYDIGKSLAAWTIVIGLVIVFNMWIHW